MLMSEMPKNIPMGITRVALRIEIYFAASTAPSVLPTPTNACMYDACFKSLPKSNCAQSNTMNCITAATPQSKVVIDSVICPSLSVHSTFEL